MMVPGATIKSTAGLEIDFSNIWSICWTCWVKDTVTHQPNHCWPHLSKLIRWWCWPPAFPQPPGCLRCFPIRPWPFAKQPRNACIDRISKELHKMWLSSSKLWTLASLSVAVHLTALPQMGHHLASELPHCKSSPLYKVLLNATPSNLQINNRLLPSDTVVLRSPGQLGASKTWT